MGLFSIFKKNKAEEFVEDDDAAARLAADSELQRQRAQSDLQRDMARATALKIDAIEAAMAADIFNEPEPAWQRPRRPARPAPAEAVATGEGNTLPLLEHDTTELLGEDDTPIEAAAAESAPIVEEIAILYANGQTDAARDILAASVRDSGAHDRTAWWMLFDLYQVLGDQMAFDDLSIDYASKFETSPPPWAPLPAEAPQTGNAGYSGLTPTVALAGVLNAGIAAQLAKVDTAPSRLPLRFDFSRVNGVEPEGCALLLEALRKAQSGQRELIVAAAPELATQIRSTLDVGRRDEGEAPWLLYLELLRLQNREKDFEEASMDYCVTFEVSPPPFVAPTKVANAPKQAAAAASDRFMLPALIDGDLAGLLAAISGYADQYPALVFDCSRLTRIEFGAAGQLLTRLKELAVDERRIEFRDVNHLVAALLRLLGYADIARLFPHRY
ncbi:MAG TPA: STAS domain-containing protein [Pseudoduganella sp.]